MKTGRSVEVGKVGVGRRFGPHDGDAFGSVEGLRLAVPLRSGEAVMLDPASIGRGLDDLASALCEVFFAEARKSKPADWQSSADRVDEEVGWLVEALGDDGRGLLLHLVILEQFRRYYGRIASLANGRARAAAKGATSPTETEDSK